MRLHNKKNLVGQIFKVARNGALFNNMIFAKKGRPVLKHLISSVNKKPH